MKKMNLISLLLLAFVQTAKADTYAIPSGDYDCDGGGRVSVRRDYNDNGDFTFQFYTNGRAGAFFSYEAALSEEQPNGSLLNGTALRGSLRDSDNAIPVRQITDGYISLQPYSTVKESFGFTYQEARMTYIIRATGGTERVWDSYAWTKNHYTISNCKPNVPTGCAMGCGL